MTTATANAMPTLKQHGDVFILDLGDGENRFNPERNDEVNTPFRQRLEQLKESIRPSGSEGNLVPPATPEQVGLE